MMGLVLIFQLRVDILFDLFCIYFLVVELSEFPFRLPCLACCCVIDWIQLFVIWFLSFDSKSRSGRIGNPHLGLLLCRPCFVEEAVKIEMYK